jgi:hypothetical protein
VDRKPFGYDMQVGDIIKWQRSWDLEDKNCFTLAIIIKFVGYNYMVEIQEVATGKRSTVMPTFLSETQ